MNKNKKKSVIVKRKKKGTGTRTLKKVPVKGTVSKPPTKKVQNWKGEMVDSVHNSYPIWGEKFLKTFIKEKTIYHTCAKMGLSRQMIAKYKRYCKEFRDDFYNAKESITDMIEESAINRAIDGHERLILFEGKPVMIKLPGMKKPEALWEKKFETALTIFMLKGRRRDEYYPELTTGGGTTDDKATSVLQAIAEIRNVMAPKKKDK